jgi:cytidylate kinase
LGVVSHALQVDNYDAIVQLAKHLDVQFEKEQSTIYLEGIEVTESIRTEACGAVASKIAAIGLVREALLDRQRAFLELPGLVADGRDMGTIVFPNATLKLFLEASAMERAKRRQIQLKELGIDVSLDQLFDEISARDKRDRERTVAPLIPAVDAVIIDTTYMPIETVLETALEHVKRLGIAPKVIS